MLKGTRLNWRKFPNAELLVVRTGQHLRFVRHAFTFINDWNCQFLHMVLRREGGRELIRPLLSQARTLAFFHAILSSFRRKEREHRKAGERKRTHDDSHDSHVN